MCVQEKRVSGAGSERLPDSNVVFNERTGTTCLKTVHPLGWRAVSAGI